MINRISISLTETEYQKLNELAKKEHRPINHQIVYMMEYYKKQHHPED